eukprot:6200632-Pleurochrysis_carterae.AAC.1
MASFEQFASALRCALSTSDAERVPAEQALAQAERSGTFVRAMLALGTGDSSLPPPARLLAVLCAKRAVERRWSAHGAGDEMGADEKGFVKASLLDAMNETDAQICTQLALITAQARRARPKRAAHTHILHKYAHTRSRSSSASCAFGGPVAVAGAAADASLGVRQRQRDEGRPRRRRPLPRGQAAGRAQAPAPPQAVLRPRRAAAPCHAAGCRDAPAGAPRLAGHDATHAIPSRRVRLRTVTHAHGFAHAR